MGGQAPLSYEEFDCGSGWTLAGGLTHASRAVLRSNPSSSEEGAEHSGQRQTGE